MIKKDRLYESAKSALLISLIIISSYIYIPMPSVSVMSFQTVFITLTAFMLSPLQSFVTIGVWLLMGAAGLPVFSGGGGIGRLFGITGGYYWGFLTAVPLMSFLKGKGVSFKRYLFVSVFAGVTTEHIFAVLVMCLHNSFNLLSAFQSISLPFIAGDILKCFLSSLIAVKLNKVIKS